MTLPTAQQATALLARARYAHHHAEPIYVTAAERSMFPEPAGIQETLFGVMLVVDDTRAAAQLRDTITRPATPMDWEIT